MVSGFFTSPLDQERIASGEATEIATYSTWLTLSSPSNSRVDSLVIIYLFHGGRARLLNFQLSEGGQSSGRRRLVERVGIPDFHIHAEGLHFLHQHVKRLRNACFEAVVTLDDALVDARAALHIIRFDREQFLERIGSAVSFHGPNFHFAEALTAILRLAAQRLLSDERVGAHRTGVNLVSH